MAVDLTNLKYLADGSLYDPDNETVLVIGGIDPHTKYGVGRNMGKDVYKFNVQTGQWQFVGELPQPRHYHGAVYLNGLVYVVGKIFKVFHFS